MNVRGHLYTLQVELVAVNALGRLWARVRSNVASSCVCLCNQLVYLPQYTCTPDVCIYQHEIPKEYICNSVILMDAYIKPSFS